MRAYAVTNRSRTLTALMASFSLANLTLNIVHAASIVASILSLT